MTFMIDSPFEKAGVWRNPFGELTIRERAELAVVDVQPWLAFLFPHPEGQARRAVQFIGDCGFGKTTHLLALEFAVAGAERVYFPEVGRRPRIPREARLLLVDEAQRMGWLRRAQMLRRNGPIVLGTHVDLAPVLIASGFEVQSVDVEQRKTPAEIAEILNRRIRSSMVDRPVDETLYIDERVAESLADRFDSNLRGIESYLFDAFQGHIRKGLKWPPAI